MTSGKMRKLFRVEALTLAMALVLLLFLSACGFSSSQQQTTFTGQAGLYPSVLGSSYGQTPQISAGEGEAPTDLQVQVLTAGSGPEVTINDQIMVRYAGTLWDGTQIDSLFGAGKSAQAFKLNQLMTGWQTGLVGQKTGSRILLVVPPDQGFADVSRLKVPAGSTQVYVIDLISTLNMTDTSALDPTQASRIDANFDKLPTWLTITGELGEKPVITVSEGATVSQRQVLMLYQGKGPNLQADDFPAVHVSTVTYSDGQWGQETSTWDSGEMQSTPTPINNTEQFLGVPLGSRMVVIEPAEEATNNTSAHDARIVVYDIAGCQSAD